MKRLVLTALIATLGLAACDGGTPTAVPTEVSRNLPPPGDDDGGGGGGGGGGGDTTVVNPPVIEYRLVYGVYRDGGNFRAYSQFERGYNGVFSRYDTSNLSVVCYVNGVFRDGETEGWASLTHITFDTPYQYGKQITCNHSAQNGAYTGTSSYTMY